MRRHGVGGTVLAALATVVLAVGGFGGGSEAWAEARTARPGASAPPTDDYRRASDMFARGERDEAAFWYYRALLRGRVHLAARPYLKSYGDPVMLAALEDSVGRPIKEWASADVPMLVAAIERVLAWHAEADDAFTPKQLIGLQAGQERILLARARLASGT